MPPTPVAAPWYGSTAEGWLCDSILNATASPSPIEMTPAFSPGPATTPSPAVGSVRSNGFELLYEQCSLHMTLNIASSRSFGSRPPKPIADRLELIVGHAETAVERLEGTLGHGHRAPAPTVTGPFVARAALSTSERMMPIPSSEPRIASAARSGCGISPATLPAAFRTPAIARSDPLGFAASSGPAGAPAPST